MKELAILNDGSHVTSVFAINQSDFINTVCLHAGIRGSFSIPKGANIVVFSSTGNFYCVIGPSARASICEGDILDGSASELNPGARGIFVEDKISLISAIDCKVIMAFYR